MGFEPRTLDRFNPFSVVRSFGRFSFVGATQLKEEFEDALLKGLPFPILTVAEYLSLDGDGFCWGRSYRSAGYYASIFLWSVSGSVTRIGEFSPLGQKLFGKTLRVDLVFGSIFSQLWQITYDIGKILIVVNGQLLKKYSHLVWIHDHFIRKFSSICPFHFFFILDLDVELCLL